MTDSSLELNLTDAEIFYCLMSECMEKEYKTLFLSWHSSKVAQFLNNSNKDLYKIKST